MPTYKKLCNYCEKFIEGDANVCPYCGRRNPIVMRCPKCRNPISKAERFCSSCGLLLETGCPVCGKPTFFGDYCQHCDASLTIICPNPKCKAEQFLLDTKCKKCGKKLK